MKAIVLAGGFGTRLRERVPSLPKPMAPVNGRPFLAYVLDQLVAGGVDEVVLSLGYQADAIIKHFGDAYGPVRLFHVVEPEPLGTGGAVAYALRGRGDAPVLVVNGDTLLGIDYAALVNWYDDQPESVAMVLREVSDTARYGSVLTADGRVCGFLEKGKTGPGLINAGVYVIQPSVFAELGLSGRFSLEADLLQKSCAILLPRAYVTQAYFIDIGIPEDYDRAQRELPALFP